MDPERREELKRRRQAAKAAPRQEIEGTIVPRLAERGVPHEPRFDGIWTPPYIRVAGNGLWWPDSPEPVEEQWCGTTSRDDPDGSKQRALRQQVIARMIGRATGPDTELRFSYDAGFETNLTLKARDALANLDVLLDSGWTIWITSRAENWLIELDREQVARLAMPPPLSAEEEASRDAAARLYAEPLTSALDRHGIDYRLVRDDDPEKPLRPRHVFNDSSSHEKETLRRGIEAGNVDRLRGEVVTFSAARSDPQASLVASLGINTYPNNLLGSPYVLFPLEALDPVFDGLVEIGNRDIRDEPLSDTALRRFELWSMEGNWLLTVTFEPRWWRIRGWG